VSSLNNDSVLVIEAKRAFGAEAWKLEWLRIISQRQQIRALIIGKSVSDFKHSFE
jgi:hypothetical protein